MAQREDEAFPSPPPPIEVEFDEPVSGYWAKRADQVLRDSYAGVQMFKFPEDLRVYEHLMWLSQPDVVIEIGACFGGSAPWFRDRLRDGLSVRRFAGRFHRSGCGDSATGARATLRIRRDPPASPWHLRVTPARQATILRS